MNRRSFWRALVGGGVGAVVAPAAVAPAPPPLPRALRFVQPQCPSCSYMPSYDVAIPATRALDGGARLALLAQTREITCVQCHTRYVARFADEV